MHKYFAVASVMVLAACGSPSVRPITESPTPSTNPATVPIIAPKKVTPTPNLIGALNPDVTQRTIQVTICIAGWTKKIRPPASYTSALKRVQLPDGARLSDYEEDHLMPLALGGAPRAIANLRPIPIKRAKADDVWEVRLQREVCSGELSLIEAQIKISQIKRR